MQIQLLIMRTPLTIWYTFKWYILWDIICSSDSSSEEMLKRAEAASWQRVYNDSRLGRYTGPCRWCFSFLIVPSGYSFKNISTASPYLSLLWWLCNPICKIISRVSYLVIDVLLKKCATKVRRLSLTLHWITEQQDIFLECVTSNEFPNRHQFEK